MSLAVPPVRRKSEFTLRIEAGYDAQPAVYRCTCGHVEEGESGHAREAMRRHRMKKHPERPAYAKKPKRPKAPKREQTAEDKKILAALAGRKKQPKKVVRSMPREANYKLISRSVLEEFYVRGKMSQTEVGAHLGVSQWTVSQALMHHGIQSRTLGARAHFVRSLITPIRAEAAWKLYEAGLSMGQIAGLAHTLWGYATVNSCQRHLARVFEEQERPKRNGKQAARNRYEIPELNRGEAQRILEAAG